MAMRLMVNRLFCNKTQHATGVMNRIRISQMCTELAYILCARKLYTGTSASGFRNDELLMPTQGLVLRIRTRALRLAWQ